MNDHSNKESSAPQLSRMRTFLFGALAFVWFAEMVQWGFLASSGGWQNIWTDFPPEAPQLATVLLITHAIRAAAKGALGVMAIFGLRSKNPAARTALFVSMALVPPLNLVFPCRADGFPLGTTAVAAIFSTILWVSFFLFREPARQPKQKETTGSGKLPPSRWAIFQYIWFAVNSAALTLMAFLFLFWPRTALDFIFPSLSSLLNTYESGLSSMISSNLSSGTHLLALAIASWIATVYSPSNPTLRQAMTVASTLHAGLICLLPLRRIILEIGGSSTTSSILVAFAPLLAGWVLYAALSYRRNATANDMKDRQEFGTWATTMKPWRRVAWLLILFADVGLLAWGAMAAVAPEHLLGPGSAPILPAEYEGFTRYSWSALANTSPMATEFMTLLFRMYGIYGVAFSLIAIAITATAFRRGDGWAWWALLVGNTLTFVAAMTYDWTVRAIGPFELTEYLGLAMVWGALAVTAPFFAAGRTDHRRADTLHYS